MSARSQPQLTSIGGSSWVDRYERLRELGLQIGARVLDGAQGLVVLMRQGMVSWMTELATGVRTPGPRRSPSARCVTDSDDRADITRTLASMIGSALTEGQR